MLRKNKLSNPVLEILWMIPLSVFLRSVISLHSFSGENIGPLFGDYEAQRHWQEICVNLPPYQWYQNTSDNDLMYWGLDYPPLTAYHSFALGIIAKNINDSYVELHKSRGISTVEHKDYMRKTVLAVDIWFYIPSLVWAIYTLNSVKNNEDLLLQQLLIGLLFPGQMLIDNGHFQYNNFSLGFVLCAIAFVLQNNYVLSAILFCLGINYKQMTLYYALPFFIYFLGYVFSFENIYRRLSKLMKLSCVILLTFVAVWLPWIYHGNIKTVVQRIFPVYRGVFEDKVSNIWCALNTFVKLKKVFSTGQMALICLICTLLFSIPSLIHLWHFRTKRNFLYSLFIVSLCFYLFSFQVHEKSILLVAMPALLLLAYEPFMSVWFLKIATLSMFPLFVKDQLLIAFWSKLVIFTLITYFFKQKNMYNSTNTYTNIFFKNFDKNILFKNVNFIDMCYIMSILTVLTISFCHLYVSPPTNFPHLYQLLNSVLCCLHFLLFFLYYNLRQIYS